MRPCRPALLLDPLLWYPIRVNACAAALHNLRPLVDSMADRRRWCSSPLYLGRKTDKPSTLPLPPLELKPELVFWRSSAPSHSTCCCANATVPWL
ncbi:hypothetical protein BS78_03G145700 [Paspalum vaginatum]|nr:hypothetical protein BS78_03G145700 [Paspalum vaginatum]